MFHISVHSFKLFNVFFCNWLIDMLYMLAAADWKSQKESHSAYGVVTVLYM